MTAVTPNLIPASMVERAWLALQAANEPGEPFTRVDVAAVLAVALEGCGIRDEVEYVWSDDRKDWIPCRVVLVPTTPAETVERTD
jgi:hypothetical protein